MYILSSFIQSVYTSDVYRLHTRRDPKLDTIHLNVKSILVHEAVEQTTFVATCLFTNYLLSEVKSRMCSRVGVRRKDNVWVPTHGFSYHSCFMKVEKLRFHICLRDEKWEWFEAIIPLFTGGLCIDRIQYIVSLMFQGSNYYRHNVKCKMQ